MPARTLTRLLAAWGAEDSAAFDRLAAAVYGELRRLAASYLRRERSGHTLETGALVHEAFLRLAGQRQATWKSRSHFFGIAAMMMRRVLVEHARSRRAARHGRGAPHLTLGAAAEIGIAEPPDVLALDEALRDLGERYPQAAEVVELRFFGGLGEEEIAQVIGVSVPTVKRRWRMARAWLHRYLAAPAAALESIDPPAPAPLAPIDPLAPAPPTAPARSMGTRADDR